LSSRRFSERRARRVGYCLLTLSLVVIAILLGGAAGAQVSEGKPASILMLPLLVVDAQHDALIQVTNTSRNRRFAHCFYIDGTSWQQTSFDLTLNAQQPTHWVLSRGRQVDASDPPCSPTNADCDAAGVDPGLVPPMLPGFRGELLCVEVEQSGFPIGGNALVGVVSLTDVTTGDVASYPAIGLSGFDTSNLDGTLCLGGGVSDTCPFGAEYSGCPQTWTLNHLADGTPDALAGSGSSVQTTLTVVPCAHDLLNSVPQPAVLQLFVFNQLEQRFTMSTSVNGWAERHLADISNVFTRGVIGTDYLQTRVTDANGGVMLLGREIRSSGGAQPVSTSAALPLHPETTFAGGEVIVLPPQF